MTRPRIDRRGRRLRSVPQARESHDRASGRDSRRAPEVKAPRYVPPPPEARPEELRPTDRVFQGLRLYPFQVRAVDAIASDHSVLVAAPTGAGKTLIADYAIEQAFAAGKRVVYTSPIKALSNQKFRDFRTAHGDDVGIMTGDVTMNPDAPLLVMTTEVFRNTLFDEPERLAQFGFVVHDEVHYLDDPERGTVWEESIIHAPSTLRLVCLSATIPNVRELADWIASVRGEEVTVVEMSHRPVPLDHMVWRPDAGPVTLDQLAKMPLLRGGHGRHRPRRDRSPAALLDWLERERLLPVLYFCFSRKDCEAHALENRRRGLLPPPDRESMRELLRDLFRRYEVEESPAVDRLAEMALSGVAYHHAGMLPVHKEIVERLFTSGLVKMLFATETFALGVNMPARTVAFDSLRKFDGERVDYMLCREYGQMAGRAGRQGIDTHGLVISRVDAAFDRPNSVRRVVTGPPERVDSRFDPDYTTILALYEHMGDRVVETYEKSFAKFQRARRRGPAGGRSSEERVLAARLGLLKRNGYIEDDRLTAKGVFTAHVSGNEIAAAEWLSSGLLDAAEGWRLGALLLSASYEPRIEESGRPPRDRALREIAERASALVEDWREAEWNAGLADLAKRPDFGLSGVLEIWCGGAELSRCREATNLSEGDIVRWLRQMLQYARQIQRALPADRAPLREKIAALVRLANRDEVDARRQLELGRDPADGDDDGGDDRPSTFAALGDDRFAPPAPASPEPETEQEPFGPDLDDEEPFGADSDDEPRDEPAPVAPRKPAAPDDDFGAGIE